MARMSEKDRKNTINRYTSRFAEYGYSPLTLGWNKGKQNIRFDILTSCYLFKGKTILDIGCGFGDLIPILDHKSNGDFSYIGIDMVPDLIVEARKRHQKKNIKFIIGDFLEITERFNVDYVIASGIFNHKLSESNEYDVIEETIRVALSTAKDGGAFDFLSDKVDYQHQHTFHSSPERILSIGYRLSRNIALRNDYMPFEFSLFIFNDDSFAKEDTVFSRYKELQEVSVKNPWYILPM